MARESRHSLANRLTAAYVGAVVVLLLLIGISSSLFTFALYARTSNEIVDLATRVVHRRLIEYRAQHISLAMYAAAITLDLARPRIRISVYDRNRRLLAGGKQESQRGVVSALAALMNLKNEDISVPGGLIVVDVSQDQLADSLRAYWMLMLPASLVAVMAAWAVGWFVTRAAFKPVAAVATALRRQADGDFSAQPLRSRDEEEIGDLAHAYNGSLHRLRDALGERDRSAAEIRQFIAAAGHELRTPLTVIIGYIDVLGDGGIEAPTIRDRVVRLLWEESRRMRTLIEKLISLARLERDQSSRREVVDVASAIAGVIIAFPQDAFSGRINVTTSPGLLVLANDEDIREIVRNILDNARKYTLNSPVDISAEAVGGLVVIVVRDYGPGMSVQDRLHAFDRFFRGRASEDVEGSGLGLAIVKRAVERYEGRVFLADAENGGTRVVISLPLIDR